MAIAAAAGALRRIAALDERHVRAVTGEVGRRRRSLRLRPYDDDFRVFVFVHRSFLWPFQRREACRAVSSRRGASGGAPGAGPAGRSGRAPPFGDLGEVGLAEQFVELGLTPSEMGWRGRRSAGAEAALLEDVLHDLPQLAGFLGEAEQGGGSGGAARAPQLCPD